MEMGSLEKAAAILVCLGVEKAAQVFSLLSFEEVQVLATQMAHTGRINDALRRELLTELRDHANSPAMLLASAGGLEFVHRLLAQTFGDERAATVLDQLTHQKGSRPFSILRTVDARRILDILASEHPSVIALVVYYLPREKAGQLLSGLVDEIRHDVVMRLVNLQSPSPQMVSRLEELLAERLADTISGNESREREFGSVTGARALVEILGRVDPTVERRVYEFLQERDPALAEEVRKSMFVFEDLNKLDQRTLQPVLRELTSQELALAMKGASEDLRRLVLSNVSSNTAKSIQEELELLGPVRVSQVEEAQQKVVATVRRLAETGIINLSQSEQEEMIN